MSSLRAGTSGRSGRWAVRAAGAVVTVVVGVAVGVGARYAAAQLLASAPSSTADAPAGASCADQRLSVGYDLRYTAQLPGYAVDAVRVGGIAPACLGATLSVSLGDGTGALLAHATATQTVAARTVRLPFDAPVAAAAVQNVYVSLAGQEQTVTAAAPPPPPPTVVQPALPPSLCATVSGTVTVTGQPSDCGAVVSAPTTEPVPVASWQAHTFSQPVNVTLTVPASLLETLHHVMGGTVENLSVVQLSVTRAADGTPVNAWGGVLAIDFPPQDGAFRSVYSEDGATWKTIPPLPSPSLPGGQPDGYFVRPDRSVTVYTRHATFYALAPPPAQVALVHAKLLPTGAIRLTWTPSAAGLGIRSYDVLRGGRPLATVPGTRTIAILRGLGWAPSLLQVVAVDPVGTRAPPSPAVTTRVPLIVGARIEASTRSGASLRAQLRLTARAGLRLFVLDARGRRLRLLPTTTVAGRALGKPAREIRVRDARSGLYRLVIRLAPSQVRAGAPYRLVALARAATQLRADRAELRLGG